MKAAAALINVFFLLFIPCAMYATTPCFTPPEKWEILPKDLLTASVQEGFFVKTSHAIPASVTICQEKVALSLERYVKRVQHLQEKEMGHAFYKLGPFSCKAGMGYLTAIQAPSPAGQIRLLQFFFLHEGNVFILTGAAPQEEFPAYQELFLQSFRSFHLQN